MLSYDSVFHLALWVGHGWVVKVMVVWVRGAVELNECLGRQESVVVGDR